MVRTHRWVFWLILGSFFVSGLAGLLYQVVWTRYLALFLGHTGYAVVAVLVAFMGGLALGNAWLGGRVDTVQRPLRFYAALEIGVGLYALIFPKYYELVHAGYLAVARSVGWSGAGLLAIKFIFAGFAILPPTVLMGATLPALTRYVTRSLAELRGKVAALYAINSSGAVLGVIVADWWWIPSMGLEAVVLTGAAMNLIIGIMALIVSHLTESEAVAEEPVVVANPVEVFSAVELRLALFGIGVSGFVAMLYEVAWTRLLALAIGSSTHAYSLMLVTFISGIAVGSWIIYRWKVQHFTLKAFAWAELSLAGTLLFSLPFYDLLPFGFAKLAGCLSRVPAAYSLYELLQGLLCLAVMFVPAVCLGTTLPLVSRVATSAVARSGSSVGRVFAVNTIGTVLGAALTGLFLMPVLGLAQTFALGIGLNALVACLILGQNYRRRFRIWLEPILALAVAWGIGKFVEPRWQKAFAIGLWRTADSSLTLAKYREQVNGVPLIYHRDGTGATVDVVVGATPTNITLSLKVNGKSDASSHGDMATQLLLGHIPMLLRPASTNALVIGAGSGATVGAMLQHSSLAGVDLVEISAEVIAASRKHFAPYNDGALTDPKTRIIIEDAKTFLKTGAGQYDVIVAEPSNPWMAGVAGVFSKEFYEDCRARLSPGGLMVQWLQIYESTDATFNMVVATFASVFPNVSIWQTCFGDRVVVGTVEPVRFDLAASAARFAEPRVAASLQRVQLDRFVGFLGLELLGFGDAQHLPPSGTLIHSDFYPRLEYASQQGFFLRGRATGHMLAGELRSPRPRTFLGGWLAQHPLTSEDCEGIVRFSRANTCYDYDLLRTVVYRWLELEPGARAALQLLSELAAGDIATDAEYDRLARLPGFTEAVVRHDPGLLRQLSGLTILAQRAKTSAFHLPAMGNSEEILRSAIQYDSENQRVHRLHLAELMWNRGKDEEFVNLITAALDPDLAKGPTNQPSFWAPARIALARVIDLYTRTGDLRHAMTWAQVAVEQGYLDEEGTEQNPRLSILTRRVYSEIKRLQERGAPEGVQRR